MISNHTPPNGIRDRQKIRTIALLVIAIAALGAALSIGRIFFVPIVFAIVLDVALGPAVRLLKRFRVPVPIGAAIVVVALMIVLSAVVYALASPLKNFIADAPQRIEQASKKLEPIRRPLRQLTEAASHVSGSGGGGGGTSGNPGGSGDGGNIAANSTTRPAETIVKAGPQEPAITTALSTTSQILGEILEVLVLLYLLLSAGDLFRHKLVKLIPQARDKAKAAAAVREVEHVVLRYLLVIATINFCQGIVIGLTMWGLGMPMPLFWGAASFIFEFVPYLGAAVMIAMLSILSFAQFDNLGHAIAVPLSYFVVGTINTSFISPYAYGKNLKLNPVAVFISVILWWFLWDVPGAFLAVPIVATVKVIADRVHSLKAVGEFLGE